MLNWKTPSSAAGSAAFLSLITDATLVNADQICNEWLQLLLIYTLGDNANCDVRLIDGRSSALYFAATAGEAWQQGAPDEVARRKSRVFPLSGNSVVARLLSSRDGDHSPVHLRNGPGASATFPDSANLYIWPLVVSGESVGCVDVRVPGRTGLSTRRRSGVSNAVRFLEAALASHESVRSKIAAHARTSVLERDLAKLAEELEGTRHQLRDQMSENAAISADLSARMLEHAAISEDLAVQMEANTALRSEHNAVIQDFHHQLGGPATAIGVIVEDVLGGLQSKAQGDRGLSRSLYRLRSSGARIESISSMIRLLSELAAGGTLVPRFEQLGSLDVWRTCERAAEAVQLASGRDYGVSLDMQQLQGRGRGLYWVDDRLLYVLVFNAIDNAFKYSFDRTTVNVVVRDSRGGDLEIEITNTGVAVLATEAERIFDRYERGFAGENTSSEGRGIGLYLAREVAEAHRGTVSISTNQSGKTRFLFRMHGDDRAS